MKSGVVIIDKPSGFTSFDVVAVMRKLLNEKKVGHTGTLDPIATGVLVVLCGNATKAAGFIEDNDKTYIASFRLGVETDTQDSTGKILRTCSKTITKSELLNALTAFCGEIEQTPPMYSAVSVGGKRLYDLARKGITVERNPRKITILKLELIDFDESSQSGSIEIECSKGTYVRTLCADIGEYLGTYAIMTALRRTKACSFCISDAITLEEAKKICEENGPEHILQTTEILFNNYRKVFVTQSQSVRFKNGGGLYLNRVLQGEEYQDGEVFSVYCQNSDFLGLAKVDVQKNELSYLKTF